MDCANDEGTAAQTEYTATEAFIQPSWTRHRVVIWTAYLVFLLFSGVMLINVSLGTLAPGYIAAPIALIAVCVWLLIASHRAKMDWQHYATQDCRLDNITQSIRDEIELRGSIWDPSQIPQRIEKRCVRLAKQGIVNRVVRLAYAPALAQLQPLTEVFEPRILDESDVAFRELEMAVASASVLEDIDAPPRYYESSVFRMIRRNFLASVGGGFGTLYLLIQFIKECNVSIRAGAVSTMLPYFGFLIGIIVVALMRSPSEFRNQWLIVTGGILHRKANLRSSQSTLHVFSRMTSILCVCQIGRWSWTAIVADSTHSDSIALTRRESDMLIRAWLSPLAPPDVERLVDFR